MAAMFKTRQSDSNYRAGGAAMGPTKSDCSGFLLRLHRKFALCREEACLRDRSTEEVGETVASNKQTNRSKVCKCHVL